MSSNSPKIIDPQIITRSGSFESTKGTEVPPISSIPLSSNEFHRAITDINKIQNETLAQCKSLC